MHRLSRFALVFALGCGGDQPNGKPPAGDTAAADTDTDTDTEDLPAYAGTLPAGEYLLGFAVAPVNNLLVPFQAVVTPTGDGERPGLAALTLALSPHPDRDPGALRHPWRSAGDLADDAPPP